ncbi:MULTISPECIES: discoidin domain-containing protein [Streptomyces violaceusniger group]|uniref:discoidin domain-containing protein n=1 Tax=Streptomyces violaceusniger group TaxID=2839105 RepID=UPI0023EA68A1|nr:MULTISPECIES: discoidin domain-containing protein [Streptomyces violaceusniger group]
MPSRTGSPPWAKAPAPPTSAPAEPPATSGITARRPRPRRRPRLSPPPSLSTVTPPPAGPVSTADKEWLNVDLGSEQRITSVRLNWGVAYGKDYDIQVSGDGTSWGTVAQRRGRTSAGSDTLAFSATTARHVRRQGITRGTGYGYSLYPVEVFA